MFVVQLVGRMADTVIETPYHAGSAGIANGTMRLATEDEVASAGYQIPHEQPPITIEEGFPAGYTVEPTEHGGFDLFNQGGIRLNTTPYVNLVAARSAAVENRDLAVTLQPVDSAANREALEGQLAQRPERTFTMADYRATEAPNGGFNILDPGGVVLNDEPLDSIETARAFAAEHLKTMIEQGEGPEDLDNGGIEDAELEVPEDWQSLHHMKQRSIARKISGEEPANTDAAKAVIEDYLRRKNVG